MEAWLYGAILARAFIELHYVAYSTTGKTWFSMDAEFSLVSKTTGAQQRHALMQIVIANRPGFFLNVCAHWLSFHGGSIRSLKTCTREKLPVLQYRCSKNWSNLKSSTSMKNRIQPDSTHLFIQAIVDVCGSVIHILLDRYWNLFTSIFSGFQLDPHPGGIGLN